MDSLTINQNVRCGGNGSIPTSPTPQQQSCSRKRNDHCVWNDISYALPWACSCAHMLCTTFCSILYVFCIVYLCYVCIRCQLTYCWWLGGYTRSNNSSWDAECHALRCWKQLSIVEWSLKMVYTFLHCILMLHSASVTARSLMKPGFGPLIPTTRDAENQLADPFLHTISFPQYSIGEV